jgi:predicted  nucleic acid-binding Zn-ribbon protein
LLKPLTYSRLEKIGFDESALETLSQLSEKFGGPRVVLEAVTRHTSLAELREREKTAITRTEAAELALKKAQVENAHFARVIEVLTALLYEHKFTAQSILDLYAMAAKYGEPREVIGAIEKYGGLKAMGKEMDSLRKQRRVLSASARETQAQVDALEGKATSIRRSIVGILTPLSSDVEALVKDVKGDVREVIKKFLDDLEADANKMSELRAEADGLGREFKIPGSIGLALIKPNATKDTPIEYSRRLIEAVYLILKNQDYNPLLIVPKSLGDVDHHLFVDSRVGMADLMVWALSGAQQEGEENVIVTVRQSGFSSRIIHCSLEVTNGSDFALRILNDASLSYTDERESRSALSATPISSAGFVALPPGGNTDIDLQFALLPHHGGPIPGSSFSGMLPISDGRYLRFEGAWPRSAR